VAGRNETLKIWLLSDGAPGHLSQSRGLAEAIGRFHPVEVREITLQVRQRLLKSLLRYLLPCSTVLARLLLHRVYTIELPDEHPDLIISSGGNTLGANALLAQLYGVPNLYSGTLKKYPAQCYTRIYTVTPQGCANNVVLPLPPVPLWLTEKMPVVEADAPWLMLIGGDGAGYRFTEADWEQLAEGINQSGENNGIRWLLTTSRRTGIEAEQLLHNRIAPALLDEAVYYGQTPRPVVREFLGRCQGVMVTEDSLTMIAEAIYSGRPVITLTPQQSDPDRNDALALEGYVASGLICRLPLAVLNKFTYAQRTQAEIPDVARLIWESLHDVLPSPGAADEKP